MLGHGHVHLGQAAPGPADGVQVGRGVGLGHGGQALGDARAQAVDVETLGIGQGEGAERQGHALVQRAVAPAVADAGQLQTGTAHVGGHAVRAGCAGQDAERRIAGFLLAAEDADLQARLGGHAGAEVGAVLGLAHGGGGGDDGLIGLHALDDGGEAAQGRHGRDDAGDGQAFGRRQITAQTGQDLFVEHGPDGPAFQPIQHQTHRVGADVDDGDLTRRIFGLDAHQRRFRALRPA
ncbi:hypothetical protein D3C72_1348350 [compost metagenome]